jgi:hypothetical protein
MLTSAEVRRTVERAEKRFLEACSTLAAEEWQFRPTGIGDRAWTIPQVIEHVTDANRGILKVLRRLVASLPRGDQAPDFEDDDLPYLFYGGGGSPPAGIAEPTGALTSRVESIAALQGSVRAVLEWYDGIDVDLREFAATHPAFGLFDGAQWLLFMAVHMRQHRGQVLDVRMACAAAARAAPAV